jgi:glutaredoxin
MPRRARIMIEITIYSRPGCHLCEEMMATVQRAMRLTRQPARLDEIDISRDPDLEARYGLEIPVLMVDGRKAAKYRVTEDAVIRLLAARTGEADGAG